MMNMHIMARLQVNQLKNNKKKTREKTWPLVKSMAYEMLKGKCWK